MKEIEMELINDILRVEDKPEDNSKFINDQLNAYIVYLIINYFNIQTKDKIN